MDTVLGVAFNDYVILATDKSDSFGILKLTEDHSKIYKLTNNVAMAIMGEPGDTEQFAKFVQCNFELEKFRDDGWEVSLSRAFHWITWELAQDIRSNHPYSVFPMLGGYDFNEKCGKVYWLDYLGTGCPVSYGGHGYGDALAIGYLDKHHRPEMTKEAGIQLVKEAINCIQTRLVIGQNKFQMVLVDKDGVHNLPDYIVDRSKCEAK